LLCRQGECFSALPGTKKGVVTLDTIKLLICKSPKGALLLIGQEAMEELYQKWEGVEYHACDITAAYGIPELVAFALKQEFRLGVEAGRTA